MGDHALAGALSGVETAICPEHQAPGSACILFEERGLAIGSDLVDLRVSRIAEVQITVVIDSRAFGLLVAFAGEFPIRIGIENLRDEVTLDGASLTGGDRLRAVAPEPAQSIGQNHGPVA